MTAGRRELSGTVTAITYPGLGSSPVLRMSMRTGDGTVTLAFLGRRDIHCIEVGSSLRVRRAQGSGHPLQSRLHGDPEGERRWLTRTEGG